ncbi:MAG: OmpA family protein [Thiolinea sp.]
MLRILSALMLFMLINVLSYSQAATAPGTKITNQAEASYVYKTKNGTLVKASSLSNIASLVVAPLLAVEQNQDQTQPATVGKPVSFPHKITNVGNQADYYLLSVENMKGDNGDLENLKIYLDENGNGQVDPGERELTKTERLKPGESIQVVVVGTVPSTSQPGDQFTVKLTTTSMNDPRVKDSDIDTVNVKQGAVIQLNQTGDVDCQVSQALGERSYHEISFKNTGAQAPEERSLSVDGVTYKGVLLEESIATDYFTLLKQPAFFVQPSQGLLLVANALGQWSLYTAWDGSSPISKIGVLMPASYLGINQSGKLGYTLAVSKLPVEQTVINQQATIDINGDGTNDFQGNTVCNTLMADPIIKDRDGQDIEGRVFDSVALLGVANAKVDLITVEDNVVVKTVYTDSNGNFKFTGLEVGEYYIKTSPPAPYTAPSTHAPTEYATTKYTQVRQASYGLAGYQGSSANSGLIAVVESSTSYTLDIPVDRPNTPNTEIAIQKQASATTVSIGELVAYTVKIRNTSSEDLYNTIIRDVLPMGFKYLTGTAKLGSEFISDPLLTSQSNSHQLEFRLGNFPAGAELILSYMTQATASATQSDGINTAQAIGYDVTNATVQSPVASAQVQLQKTGVLSDRAILFGRLALEKGCPVGTPEEQAQGYPLAGVRLYMEDGTYVITDINGQYSLYGLQPGVHVLKVDQHTVPTGLDFQVVDVAQAGDPDSRFVDLIPGDFHRADFTAGCPQVETRTVEECAEPVKKQVQECTQKPVVTTTTEMATRTVKNPVQAIHFDSGKAVIPPEYLQKLNKVVQMTKDKQNVRFQFVGHTDNERLKPSTKEQFGTNQGLSEARAKEVADYVQQNLGQAIKISVAGRGETQPIASNDQPQGMAKNRRVELILSYEEPVQKQVKQQQLQQECKTREVADPRSAGCTTRTITVDNPALKTLLANNKTTAQGWNNEVQNLDPANTENLQNLARFADKNGDISNGLMEAHRQQVKNQQENFATEHAAEIEQQTAEPAIPNPKEVVKTLTTEQGQTGTWLWPLSDTSLDGRFMVVIRSEVEPSLLVNGKPVSSSQLGEQIVNKSAQAQVLAWYGVDLQEGVNELKVVAKDNFGNERTLAEKTVKRPSAGVAIKLKVGGTLTADRGRSTVPVQIDILDLNNYPAKGTYFLTLEASDGTWAEPDIQDKVPGHQVKVTNGTRTVHLRSSGTSGEVKLRVSTGTLQSETDVAQIAEMRPLIAVGLLDLRAHTGYAKGYKSLGLTQLDNQAEGTEFDGRSALFVKGKVRGDMHLTMAYDSAKDKEAELLRDINPDEYYRVYGDSSLRGFEAQSRSKLYVKVEKDRNSAMWGDYITDNDANSADIARVSRTLTGFNGVYDNGDTRVQLFAAQQDNLRGFEEIPGNGTAMHYQLQGHPIVRNSDVVEIITRDRGNIGLITKTEKLTRFIDYSLDDVSGYISFHKVIPTLDDELNPVAIRITYDRVEQGDDYLVAGVRLMHRFTDEFSAGASYTKDDHSTEGYDVVGAFAQYKTADTEFQAGVSKMEHADGSEGGTAVRLQASKKWNENSRTQVTAVQADAGYTNSTSGVTADRRELKLTHEQKLTANLEAKAELTHSESLSTEDQRQTAELSATTKIDDWKLKGGIRNIRQADANGEENINTAIVGVERNIKIFERNGSIKGEYEREIGGESDRQRASVGAELEVNDKTKAYIRYEQADRLSSGTLAGAVDTSNSLVAGVKTQVLPSTELYSEYRIEGDISGEEVVAVNGGKATFDLEKNLVVTPGIEFMNYGADSEKSDSIAASVGLSDTRDPDAKKLLRVETRQSDDEKYYGVSGTYVQKLNESTTVMAQDDLRLQQYEDGREDALQNTLTLAAAHRPTGDGDYNALYAYKWDKNDADNTNTHILSTQQHYRYSDQVDLSGRVGAKHQTLKSDNNDSSSNAALADGRVLWDLNDRFSVDVHGGVLTGSNESTAYSLGAGVAFNVIDNVRLGAGYNFLGFSDSDLDSEGFNAQGGYIGLQMKADEALFGWLAGDKPECAPQYMAGRDQLSEQAKRAEDDCNKNNNDKKAANHEQQPTE